MLPKLLNSTAAAVNTAPISNGSLVVSRSNSGQKISAMPATPQTPPSPTRRDSGVPKNMRASAILTNGIAE